MKPLVSALMATNREAMAVTAVLEFAKQDYANREIRIANGPESHGAKMDRLFREASGEYACVWDDDDAYAPDRISRLIQQMIDDPQILCVGTSLVCYVDERIGKAWLYDNQQMPKSYRDSNFWLAAPAYRREAYELYGPWEDLPCGADLQFLHKIPREQVLDLRDSGLMVCRIHSQNAAQKKPHVGASSPWSEIPMEQLPRFYAKE